jgi:UTP-glucose-1-phosphate uridylyltransferase
MGRYVFSLSIFDALNQVQPGHDGEIQLTDAIKMLLGEESVYGWTFRDGRASTWATSWTTCGPPSCWRSRGLS